MTPAAPSLGAPGAWKKRQPVTVIGYDGRPAALGVVLDADDRRVRVRVDDRTAIFLPDGRSAEYDNRGRAYVARSYGGTLRARHDDDVEAVQAEHDAHTIRTADWQALRACPRDVLRALAAALGAAKDGAS